MKAKLIRWPVALLVSIMAISLGAVASRAQYDNMPMQTTPPNNTKDKAKMRRK